jgi:hypothetical protein
MPAQLFPRKEIYLVESDSDTRQFTVHTIDIKLAYIADASSIRIIVHHYDNLNISNS